MVRVTIDENLCKGCGLCVAEERFKETLLDVKKQRETPQMVRGMEISSLSVENLRRNKEEKKIEDIRIQHISYAVITVYMLFFTFLFKILSGIEETVREAGLGIQADNFVAEASSPLTAFLNEK